MPGSAPAPSGLDALVIEDDPGTRWLFSEILRSRGHRVVAVADARSARIEFDTTPAALVMLDLGLPDGDGLELCRRLRAHPHGDDAVILVVTGQRDPAVLQGALESGADDYVAKPVDVPLLNIRLAVAERDARRKLENRSAQRRLIEQGHSARALLDNLDEVIFSLDPNTGAMLRVSPAAQRVLGRSADELMADETLWRMLLYPPEVELRQSELELARARPIVHRWQIRLPDGTARWVEVTVKGVLEEGRLARIDGRLSDVTETKRAQEELAARNKELMTLYRISEVTLGAPSAERAYEEVLEELCKATGFPIAAIEQYDAGQDRLVITAARGIPLEAGPLEIRLDETLSGVAVRTGRPVVESNARHRLEMTHPLLRTLGINTWMSFPMVVGQQVVGTLTLAHTEVVEPDRRLVRWAGSLANLVAQFLDRVAAEDALRDSERRYRTLAEQLQQANQELESFAYSVSHDLRAPLRTMQGFAHALIQNFGERLPAEARDYAQRIIASGQQSEILIRDLLAYSRLSFEQVELQPVELTQVVDTALEQLAGDVQESGADVAVEGTLPAVQAQATILGQVIANLISNAIKFVPLGQHARVRIRADERDHVVRLIVEDNGIGVPEGQEDRIFRVFERLTESGARPGTGIGLAIVRRGMERMGGRAGVTRHPDGGGSCFWVDIPRVQGARRSIWARRRSRG